jgi:hypothetical protein
MTTVTDPTDSDGGVFPLIAKRLALLAVVFLIVFMVVLALVAAAAWLLQLIGLELSTDARFLMATMMVSSIFVVGSIILNAVFITSYAESSMDDEADWESSDADEDEEDDARWAWLKAELSNARRQHDLGVSIVEYDRSSPSSRASRSKTNSRNPKKQRDKLRK